jgi:tRNA(Ile)-lysidine synthase
MTFSADTLAATLVQLIGNEDRALAVALSGGADSAALLRALADCRRTHARWRVRALHVNHGLGPFAATLERAAREVARACEVPLTVLAVTVPPAAPEGVEAAARAARYEALRAALAPGEFALTAHHLEDQAETLLLQLLRGAGLKGLAAMPVRSPLGSGVLLRPLLATSAAQLRAYAAARGLASTEDPMNHDARYDRAYLRAEVWPRLEARWPKAAETLARSARHAWEAQSLLDATSEALLATVAAGPALRIEGLRALSAPRRGELIRFWLARQGLRPPPARRQARIDTELLGARPGSHPRLVWEDGELRSFAGYLYAFAPLGALDVAGERLPGADEPERQLGALGRLEVRTTLGTGLKLPASGRPFTLALRAGGERLRLAPGGARRPLKDLLREARVPPWARERAILVSGDALAAVVLPHATWIAAECRAEPGDVALGLAWRDAPAALWPPPAVDPFIERERPFS